MLPVRRSCVPRPEVLQGDLEDAIFAADFGHVIDGNAPKVYQNPSEFFRNTHPAEPLKKVVSTVFERLTDPDEAGAVLRLSTGFGGGKTHTLIVLWHLANQITDPHVGTELLAAAGRPKRVAVAGVDGGKAGSSVVARHEKDGVVAKSLWGEIAYQLGGTKGYAKVESVDHPEDAPDTSLIRSILPADRPVLILLDELVIYMAQLSSQGQGALLGFLNSLMAEMRARKQACLVISDPAGQVAYQRETSQLGDAIEKQQTAQKIDDMLARKMSDFNPIGGEAAQVIIRRLFETIDTNAAHEASMEYHNAYTRIVEENPDLLPREAATIDYAQRIVTCYPFHPRLLDTAQNRLGALQDFQKSRGVLRLFARVLRDQWERDSDVALVNAGDIDWSSERIRADLLARLNRDSFVPAVDEDVLKHAGLLDADFATDIHRRVAGALLLESLPMTSNAAMDRRDLTLATIRPSDVGHEASEAMDRLMSVCWHTYPADESRTRFQFRFEPNVNKLIDERAGSVAYEDARMAVLTMAQAYFGGSIFKLISWPSSPKSVSDTSELKLVLADTEDLTQRVCNYLDDSDPDAKQPRRFRNAIFGVAPNADALNEAVQSMRRLQAADGIAKEQRGNKIVKVQIDDLLPNLRRRTRIRVIRAFNRVVFNGKSSVTLDEKYLVSEENPLEGVNGQARLKQFLDDKKLVYGPTDSLDVDLLVGMILPGATPSLDNEGAFTASAVHERALASDKLRLLMNDTPIRNSIYKAVETGKLAVRLPTGEAFDNQGSVVTVGDTRQRMVGKKLPGIKLNADVLVAPAKAICVSDWTKIDEEKEEKGPTPKPPLLPESPPTVTATDWEAAIGYAGARPLLSLILRTAAPTTAKTLIGMAPPFNATAITLSVQAMGKSPEGAEIRFAVSKIKHSHPLKPLDMAATLLRAMGEESTFKAELELTFGGEGIKDAASKLATARDAAMDDVTLMARFGPEDGGAA